MGDFIPLESVVDRRARRAPARAVEAVPPRANVASSATAFNESALTGIGGAAAAGLTTDNATGAAGPVPGAGLLAVDTAANVLAPLSDSLPGYAMPDRDACAAAGDEDAFVRELSLARLTALEAFDRARDGLLERLARDVLGRELELAPCDIAALTRSCLEAFAVFEPVALVVAPGEAASVQAGLPVREDASLVPGDLLVAVRDGEIDARFHIRAARAIGAR